MKSKRKKNGPSEPAIFCTKCGNKLLPDTVFCEQCGTRVPIPATTDVYTAAAPVSSQNGSTKKKVSKGTVALFVVLGILLIATIVAAIFIISGLGSEGKAAGGTNDGGYSSSYQDKFFLAFSNCQSTLPLL